MSAFQRMNVKITKGKKKVPAMQAFDVISSLSGGSFPNTMYHYAQKTDSDTLLDTKGIQNPRKLKMEDFETIPDTSIFKPLVTPIIPNIILSSRE